MFIKLNQVTLFLLLTMMTSLGLSKVPSNCLPLFQNTQKLHPFFIGSKGTTSVQDRKTLKKELTQWLQNEALKNEKDSIFHDENDYFEINDISELVLKAILKAYDPQFSITQTQFQVFGLDQFHVISKASLLAILQDLKIGNLTSIKDFSKGISEILDSYLFPTKYLNQLQWPMVFRLLIHFSDFYSPEEVDNLISYLKKHLPKSKHGVIERYDTLLKESIEVPIPFLLTRLKDLIPFASNYNHFRNVMIKSGLAKQLKELDNIKLPSILVHVDPAEMQTHMKDKGENPTFKNLKTGLQLNGLINPFGPYIGKPFDKLPLKKIEQELTAELVAKSLFLMIFGNDVMSESERQLLSLLKSVNLREMKVFHRTRSTSQLNSILKNGAVLSQGSGSVFNGAATWGEGFYFGFSEELYHYGPYQIEYQINPNAIIGKDIDIFVGGQDGLIGVAKTNKAFLDSYGNFKDSLTPKHSEPIYNQLIWFAERAHDIPFSQKKKYIEDFLDDAFENPHAGPFTIWILFNLDLEILNDKELTTKASRVFKAQSANLSRWPLLFNPQDFLRKYENSFSFPLEELFEKIRQTEILVEQIRQSKIVLKPFEILPVPERLGMITEFFILRKHRLEEFLKMSYYPLVLLEDLSNQANRYYQEVAFILRNTDFETLSDQRFLYATKSFFESFQRISDSDDLIRPLAIESFSGRFRKRLLSYDPSSDRFKNSPEIRDFLMNYRKMFP